MKITSGSLKGTGSGSGRGKAGTETTAGIKTLLKLRRKINDKDLEKN
jgi:hypothetical protein